MPPNELQTRTLLARNFPRTAGDPVELIGSVRAQVRELDPDLPLLNPTPLADAIGVTLLPQRMGAILLAGFGAVALLLSLVGLYGVLAYSVGRRTREIGIRLAVGAQPGQVLRTVVTRGLAVTGLGLVLGLAAGAGVARLIGGFLFDVSAGDPATFAPVGTLMIVAALAATYVPARRAASVDPARALRYE